MTNLLIAEDEDVAFAKMEEAFQGGDYEVKRAPTVDAAKHVLKSFWPDFVILDANIPTSDPNGDPEFNAEKVLMLLESDGRRRPLVLLTSGLGDTAKSHGSKISEWLLRERIYSLMPKGMAWEFMQLALRQLLDSVARYQIAGGAQSEFDHEWLRRHGIISNDESLFKVAKTIRRIVNQTGPDATVLLMGPRGCGKGLFARAIHAEACLSIRRSTPFVVAHCGELVHGETERVLFGTAARHGVLEESGTGVLFLDDVDHLPLATQAALLRALEDRRFRRLDDIKDSVFRARVVAATNANLTALVAEGKFRLDLYDRLARVPLQIPPLADRPKDIEALALYFLKSVAEGKPEALDREVVTAFQRYTWPGNVRQLEDLVRRVKMSQECRVVTMADLQSMNVEYLGESIVWTGGTEDGTPYDDLLFQFSWDRGWRALKTADLDLVKGWLKECLPAAEAEKVDKTVDTLSLRGSQNPETIHYLKAWLFLALNPNVESVQSQLERVLVLKYTQAYNVLVQLAGESKEGMPEMPVVLEPVKKAGKPTKYRLISRAGEFPPHRGQAS